MWWCSAAARFPQSRQDRSMQLDDTRIAIRERDLLDVLDLSLQVIRAYALPWLLTTIVGAMPFAVLNWWLLRKVWPHRGPLEPPLYLSLMAILIAWELPLASAGLTAYIGKALFVERPQARQVVRDVTDSLPQLLIFQVIIRGLFFLPALWLGEVWWLMVFAIWIPFMA